VSSLAPAARVESVARVERQRNPRGRGNGPGFRWRSTRATDAATLAWLIAAAIFTLGLPAADAAADAGAIDPAVAARLLALDCERLSDADVRETLAHLPAPRVILLQGSLGLATMQPFGEFLVAMGYPEERIRNPRDGTLSHGSFGGSDALAGNLAWYYEREGMVPVLIGHSHGGMLVVRTLHELAGAFADAVAVRDPRTDEALPRTTFVDPATGKERPVVGLTVGYASAIATGKLPRLLMLEWSMLPKLRLIPDTAVDFTGFAIAFDLIAFDFGGSDPYVASGTARVRNVTLPGGYSHIGIPQAQHLAANPVTRAWIEAYAPGAQIPAFPEGTDTTNLLHTADIWFSLKKNWCVEARRSLPALRAEAAP
jgi:hypothetical protein